VRYNPPHFELLAQAVGCVLPLDSHLDVYDVHTLLKTDTASSTLLTQCAHQQSAIPYVAMVLLVVRLVSAS
jgi:hypothetical protein